MLRPHGPAHLARRTRPPPANSPVPEVREGLTGTRYRFEQLRMIGWGRPRQVLKIVNWCGHSQDFVAWPEADGYWRLVPVMGEAA